MSTPTAFSPSFREFMLVFPSLFLTDLNSAKETQFTIRSISRSSRTKFGFLLQGSPKWSLNFRSLPFYHHSYILKHRNLLWITDSFPPSSIFPFKMVLWWTACGMTCPNILISFWQFYYSFVLLIKTNYFPKKLCQNVVKVRKFSALIVSNF